MKVLSWSECDDRKEVEEGNRVCLSSGIVFYLNHNDSTALMNENNATREDKIEACKFIASLGYTPKE